jgi:hypothetical protein
MGKRTEITLQYHANLINVYKEWGKEIKENVKKGRRGGILMWKKCSKKGKAKIDWTQKQKGIER